MAKSFKSSSVFLRPKDTKRAASHVRGHSKWVGLLRWGLPVTGLFLLAGIVFFPFIKSLTVQDIVSVAPNLAVDHLRLSGLDAQDQPYSLVADRVLYAAKEGNLVDLENPEGEIELKEGDWLAGKASYGRYDMTGKKLWLGGKVQFFHDKGYIFTTQEAQINVSESTAWGKKPVVIQGSFGTIEGEGFKLLKGGKIFIVEGKSKAKLNLRASTLSDKPKPNPKPKNKGQE